MVNEPSVDLSLVSELPGAFRISQDAVTKQDTNSLVKQVTKTARGRSHGTRRNRSSRLVRQIKRYGCTTTGSLLLPVEN